jgi:hypothetical protein
MEGLFVDHLKITDEREIIDNLIAGRKRAAAKQLTAVQDEEDASETPGREDSD